jgi:hypothetical protein
MSFDPSEIVDRVLRECNINASSRREVIDNLKAKSASKTTDKIADSVHAVASSGSFAGSLRRHAGHLSGDTHEQILRGFRSDGLVNDGDGGAIRASASSRVCTTLRAVAGNPKNERLVNYMLAEAGRLGVKIEQDTPVHLVDVDRACVGKPIEQRLRFKAMLHELGMIPA